MFTASSAAIFLQVQFYSDDYTTLAPAVTDFSEWIEFLLDEYPISSLIAITHFFLGCYFVYSLFKRSNRVKRNDKIQSRALIYSMFAVLFITLTTVSFVLKTMSASNFMAPHLYGSFFWMAWQIGLNGFIGFGIVSGLAFLRTKASNDIFQLTSMLFFFGSIFALFNQAVWGLAFMFIDGGLRVAPNLPLGSENLHFTHSRAAHIAVHALFMAWVFGFLYIGFRIFRRSAVYVDDSARDASQVLSYVFTGIGFLGLIVFFLFRLDIEFVISSTYVLSLLIMVVFYFGINEIYKHGRYKRI